MKARERPLTVAPTLILAVFLGGCATPADEPGSASAGDGGPTDTPLESVEQKGSYAIGLSVGRNLRQQGVDVQLDQLIEGLNDGIADEPRLEDAEAQAALQELQAVAVRRAAALNKTAGDAFLGENGARDGVITTGSGLQYEVLEAGDGPSPSATDRVTVHYRGTLIDGTVFDESYARGVPSTFAVNAVIPGWTEAMQLMRVGARWKVYVSGELGYGLNLPPGARFGPNETLIFEVELLDIVSP